MSAAATMVRERPLLMSGPMVRAILDDKKTQTRRVVKPQPNAGPNGQLVDLGGGSWGLLDGDLSGEWRQPYGQPGDRLWVRETAWYDRKIIPVLGYRRAFFEGGDMRRENANGGESGRQPGADKGWNDSYTAELYALNDSLVRRPSIHMPRWASRITLEITDVRVERLQEIVGQDVVAEGVECPTNYGHWHNDDYDAFLEGEERLAVEAYRKLWDSLNAKRGFGWDVNPFVWAISFKRIAS